MHCDNEIHEYLSEKHIYCPFCNQKIGEQTINNNTCCNNQDILYDNGNICKNCGLFYGYNHSTEYIDFHLAKYKINRKSIYHRKYHIYNKINDIYNVSSNDREKFIQIFNEIDKILPQINQNRKRMININFIFKKIFNMMKIDVDIKISKSNKTLKKYDLYWKKYNY